MAASLDLNRFRSIISEYAETYENPPATTAQVVKFCKSQEYPFKYGQLNPFFCVWKKQVTPSSPKFGSTPMAQDSEDNGIDWDSLWSEYETKYEGSPKNPSHLYNFAKEDKGLDAKYKAARHAFARISVERASVEGATADVLETNGQSMSPQKPVILVFPKKRSDEVVETAKTQFLELLDLFRSSIMHDPSTPLQLFNFINEHTQYKAKYGHVKRCYKEAVKEKWFRPMKRVKKGGKSKKVATPVSSVMTSVTSMDVDSESEEGVHFVLEVDEEAERKEQVKVKEENKEVVPLEAMDDEEFTVLLAGYTSKYKNPPRNASQIMHFAKEQGQCYRYKACRVAFQRWNNIWNQSTS